MRTFSEQQCIVCSRHIVNIYLATKELYDELTQFPVVIPTKRLREQVKLQERPDFVCLRNQEGVGTRLVRPLPQLEIINPDECEAFPELLKETICGTYKIEPI